MKKIKLNEKHDAIMVYFVCKSNADKPYGEVECERLYNDLREYGVSLYHQCSREHGYRIRVFELDNYVYLTMAINYNNNERVSIQEYEQQYLKDAISIAKFMKARIVEYDNNRMA